MGDSSTSFPSRWSWYLQGQQKPIYDPHGDVQLILAKKVTQSAVSPDTGTVPTEKVDEGKDAQLEDPHGQHDEASSSEAPTAHENQEIEATVSSKHLSLASRVFRAMFGGNFREGVVPAAGQLTKVPLPEDDADAMMVLLGIIHGLSRSVPRTIDYELFFAIVVLIDKYELQEATGVYTDAWFSDLWPARNTFTPHLANWIYICWVVKRSFEYTQATREAISSCTSRFEDNGLPFPAGIPRDIETSRLSVIEDMLTYLKYTVECYQNESQQCRNDARCDAFVLGDLIKKLKIKGLYPVPEADALSMSIRELFSHLRGLQVSSLCEIHPLPRSQSPFGLQQSKTFCGTSCSSSYGSSCGTFCGTFCGTSCGTSCGVREGLKTRIIELEKGIKGLSLHFFTP